MRLSDVSAAKPTIESPVKTTRFDGFQLIISDGYHSHKYTLDISGENSIKDVAITIFGAFGLELSRPGILIMESNESNGNSKG